MSAAKKFLEVGLFTDTKTIHGFQGSHQVVTGQRWEIKGCRSDGFSRHEVDFDVVRNLLSGDAMMIDEIFAFQIRCHSERDARVCISYLALQGYGL